MGLDCLIPLSTTTRTAPAVSELATETEDRPVSTALPNNGGGDEAARCRRRVAELEEEVLAKDELVTALTVQMEQLAEQLDRLQRTGADRKRSNALPVELVDGHKKVVSDLERIVQQWEDMQAALTLGRLEVQINELRDFIGERLSGGGHPGYHSSGASAHANLSTSVVLERISVSSTPLEPPALEIQSGEIRSSESSLGDAPQPVLPTSWESLKSQMLNETPQITAEAICAGEASEAEPPLPAPFSPITATPQEIEAAVDQRDAYITYLLRRLRTQATVQTPPDWVALEHAPEELCSKLTALQQQLEEHLRHAEVEMSIERARIGREQSHLRQQQELIEKQMRRLGLKTVDEQQTAPIEPIAANDRRWVRFLGLPRANG